MESISNQNIFNQNQRILNEGELVGNCLDDFEILSILGGGSFGRVYKVKSKKNNKIYALKKIQFYNDQEKQDSALKVKKEVILLKYLNHENICKCITEFTDSNGVQFLVMEAYNNKDIFQYVKANLQMGNAIKEKYLWHLFHQCIEGLSYLQNNGIIHSDIKLANLFMTEEGKIVIGDFGESSVIVPSFLSKITNNPDEQELLKFTPGIRGTQGFIDPEILTTKMCDKKSDVYSLGIVFYSLLNGKIPDFDQFGNLIRENNSYSKYINRIVLDMIITNRQQRPDISEVKKKFDDYYFKKFIKNSGIHSLTRCLLGYKNFMRVLTDNALIGEDENNSKKVKVSFIFISIKDCTNVEISNYQLKEFFSSQYKLKIKDNNDISPLKVVFCLLNSLNNELNTKRNAFQNPENLNKQNMKTILLQNTNVKYLYNEYINSYKQCFNSIISNDFLGALKVTWTCNNCRNNYISFEKFFSINFNINNLPINYNQGRINIYELFNNYNNSSHEIGLKKFVICQNCKKFTQHSVNKKFYNLPKNLIIMLERDQNNFIEIELQTEINFNNSIAENISQIDYKLVGIIYINDNKNENSKYVPIINEKDVWYEYKYGQDKKVVNINYIFTLKRRIIALFYINEDRTDSMFEDDENKNINMNNNQNIININNNNNNNNYNNMNSNNQFNINNNNMISQNNQNLHNYQGNNIINNNNNNSNQYNNINNGNYNQNNNMSNNNIYQFNNMSNNQNNNMSNSQNNNMSNNNNYQFNNMSNNRNNNMSNSQNNNMSNNKNYQVNNISHSQNNNMGNIMMPNNNFNYNHINSSGNNIQNNINMKGMNNNMQNMNNNNNMKGMNNNMQNMNNNNMNGMNNNMQNMNNNMNQMNNNIANMNNNNMNQMNNNMQNMNNYNMNSNQNFNFQNPQNNMNLNNINNNMKVVMFNNQIPMNNQNIMNQMNNQNFQMNLNNINMNNINRRNSDNIINSINMNMGNFTVINQGNQMNNSAINMNNFSTGINPMQLMNNGMVHNHRMNSTNNMYRINNNININNNKFK